MSRKRREKPNRRRGLWLVAGLFLLIVCIGGLLVYRSGILNQSHSEQHIISKTEPYTFDTGIRQVFAPMKGGLAVGSTTGLQILDADGVTIARSVVSITTPALAASDTRAVVYDVGGTALRVGDRKGNLTVLDSDEKIISVTMNEAGYLAVVTEETGYKGRVTVYNGDLEPVYAWHSGSNYVLSARVSPDCTAMAALTLGETGSAVHIFSLSSETEYAVYDAQDLLLFDCTFMDNGRICAIHDGGLLFFTIEGSDGGSYSFSGKYLSGYSFEGDGFATVMLSQYQSGKPGTVVTVGYGGAVTGQLSPQDTPQSLSVQGKKLLIRYGEYLALYSQSLEETSRQSGGQGAKDAVLTDKNRGYLLYSGYCEPITF